MAEEIKSLIEKIQKEGIDKARENAKRIEEEARAHAADIIGRAKKEADALIEKAKEESLRLNDATNAALAQSARDFLIKIKEEANAMLKKIIVSDVEKHLNYEEMSKIINVLIKEHSKGAADNIEIIFNPKDLEKMKEHFLSRLSESLKKGITLKSSQSLSAGFTISFDAGRSYFDFSAEALAEYLSTYLNKELAKFFRS